jgi:UDP-3-O-[3-hydroxymyristoyl] glucosamine N-acyltransferase LpxD
MREAAARGAAIVCADPYLAFARLTQWWARKVAPAPVPACTPAPWWSRAPCDASERIIGPLAYIARGARIGEGGAVIGSHCHLGEDSQVGAHTCSSRASRSAPAAASAIAASCTAVPSSGPTALALRPPRPLGKDRTTRCVRIGDDVEIGANTCVDRGALEDTVLEDGVKLDNLVQIGHNVHIGAHTAFAGCVGVAGSARIGRHCTAGGGAIILGHLEIATTCTSPPPRSSRARSASRASTAARFPSMTMRPGKRTPPRCGNCMRCATAAGAGEEELNTMLDIQYILRKLPHRYPFLLVDRVIEFEKGVRIKALKNVTINEPFFPGHFPARPVMPGVLMLEALAQAARCCPLSRWRAPEPTTWWCTSSASTTHASSGPVEPWRPADPGSGHRPRQVRHLPLQDPRHGGRRRSWPWRPS